MNSKVATTLIVPSSGPLVIVALGAWIVHVQLSGLGSTTPFELFARTWRVCWPRLRPSSTYGVSQEPQMVAVSSRHSNSTFRLWSFEENVKVAFGLSPEVGGFELMVVFGATIVHSWTAGVASASPETVPIARTMNVWSPASWLSSRYGDSQEPQAIGSAAGVSGSMCAHSNSGGVVSGSAIGSLDVKVNVASALALGSDGLSTIVVLGTTESSAVAIPNGERLSTVLLHTSPVTGSLEVVRSTHAVPSWWSRRTGSAREPGV